MRVLVSSTGGLGHLNPLLPFIKASLSTRRRSSSSLSLLYRLEHRPPRDGDRDLL
jgi:hypothetical protein